MLEKFERSSRGVKSNLMSNHYSGSDSGCDSPVIFYQKSKRSSTFSKIFGSTIMDSISLFSYSSTILILLSTICSTSFGMATSPTTGHLSTNKTVIISASDIPMLRTTTTEENPPSILIRSASSHHVRGNGSGGGHQHNHQHKCYVCLPPDRNSGEGEQILNLFKGEEQNIPDCASFTQNNKKTFEFKCPSEYRGCQLRIHGTNVSRSCGRYPMNDCKTANSVELCYCSGPLCNEQKLSLTHLEPEISSPTLKTIIVSLSESSDSEERAKARLADEKDEAEGRKFWQKGETDDEDLLEMQEDESSGDGRDDTDDNNYPPGVIDQYTTTPKPTLVPNLRPDNKFKPTAPPPSSSTTPTSSLILMASSALFCLFSSFLLEKHTLVSMSRP